MSVRFRLAAGITGLLGASALVTAAAMAPASAAPTAHHGKIVVATTDYDSVGVAGAHTFGGARVNSVHGDAVITAGDANLPITTSLSSLKNGVGIAACNNNTGQFIGLGFTRVPDNGTTKQYSVAYARLTLVPTLDNPNPCEHGIVGATGQQVTPTALSNLPGGTHLIFQIKFVDDHHSIVLHAQNAAGTDVWSVFLPGAGFWATEAGGGVQGNLSMLGGTPSVLTGQETALRANGHAFGTHGDNAALIFSSGTASPPPLMDSALSGQSLNVFQSPNTGP